MSTITDDTLDTVMRLVVAAAPYVDRFAMQEFPDQGHNVWMGEAWSHSEGRYWSFRVRLSDGMTAEDIARRIAHALTDERIAAHIRGDL